MPESPGWTPEELMAAVVARGIADGDSVAVGTLAPMPAAGALLAHFTHAPHARPAIINHPDYWPFRNGSKEFYDWAQRRGLDLFFLSGGQIDAAGNLNLVAVGDPARPSVRFPGGAGAAMLYYAARRVVVFRMDHTPRVFVERVDHVTAPGRSAPDVPRRGGPWSVLTPLCAFRFDPALGRLVVASRHPGVGAEELAVRTGFSVDGAALAPETPAPTPDELAVLRGPVRQALEPLYPRFAVSALGR